MNTDLSFITNEENQNLKERFMVLIKDTSFFDCLVGYFYSSGFHAVYPALWLVYKNNLRPALRDYVEKARIFHHEEHEE